MLSDEEKAIRFQIDMQNNIHDWPKTTSHCEKLIEILTHIRNTTPITAQRKYIDKALAEFGE